MSTNYVVLDVQTTGLSLEKDKVIKVSLLKGKLNKSSVEKMTEFVNPGRLISPEITKINGITNDDLKDACLFSEIADKINEFIDGNTLVGYNIKKFDLPMLFEEFYRVGKKLDISGGVIDLYEIYTKEEPRDLSGAYRHYCGSSDDNIEKVEAMNSIFYVQASKYRLSKENLKSIVKIYTDPTKLDIAGKFKKDQNTGNIYLCFGKYKDKTLEYVKVNDPEYLYWILESDFPAETKIVLSNLLENKELS